MEMWIKPTSEGLILSWREEQKEGFHRGAPIRSLYLPIDFARSLQGALSQALIELSASTESQSKGD